MARCRWLLGVGVLAFLCLVDEASAYMGSGKDVYEELDFAVAPNTPNYREVNVSEWKAFRFRINPQMIRDFNLSTAMLRFDFQVEKDTPSTFPVFISVAHKRGNFQLQLPYTLRKSESQSPIRYTFATRRVCLEENTDLFSTRTNDHVIVFISTGSAQRILVQMKVIIEDNILRPNVLKSTDVSAISPSVFRVPYVGNMSPNVVIRVHQNANYGCLAIGIAKPECPIFPVGEDFRMNSGWSLISSNGSVRVDRMEFLNGFYVKVVLLQDDSLCSQTAKPRSQGRLKSTVSLKLENDLPLSASDGNFWLQLSLPLLLSLIVGVVVAKLYLVTYTCTRKEVLSCRTYNVNKTETTNVAVLKFSGAGKAKSAGYGKATFFIFLLHAVPIMELTVYNLMVSNKAPGLYGMCSSASVSSCSHKVWIFEDFNHLWSNVCYLVLGVCFLFIAFVKKLLHGRSEDDEGIQFHVGIFYGMAISLIAKGLMSFTYHLCPSKANFEYDAIYLSLIFGICHLKLLESRRPNTFNLKTSIGALSGVFLVFTLGINLVQYLEDHFEDFFFGFRIAVATVQGILIFYACVYAIYIGYPINRFAKTSGIEEVPLQQMTIIGRITKQNGSHPTSNSRSSEDTEQSFMKSLADIPRFLWIFPKIWHWKLPKFRLERFIYVILLLGLNGCLIYFSLTANYSLYIFIFLGTNLSLNLVYYFLLKLVFGEFSCSWKSLQVFLYFLLFLAFGALAGYLFWMTMWEWGEPMPEYRPGDPAWTCSFLKPYPFYDFHDAWHMVSAHAIFFLFMVLLTIDDGVEAVNQEFLVAF